MLKSKGFAAQNATSALAPFSFERREPGPTDILIEIDYCGICHSDIHQVRNEWGGSVYPMVPGHEVVGRVVRVGGKVGKFKVGDLAGVGCFVDSCRSCVSCKEGEEQYCEKHLSLTYNSTEADQKTPTFGGYSSNMVVDEKYALAIPRSLEFSAVAPLLCAGITTYAPLRRLKVGKGHRIGIHGLGGLGHMGVKFAASFGAEVTVLSTSPGKKADAERLGAHNFVVTKNEQQLAAMAEKLDFILDTVSGDHGLDPLLGLLKRDGTYALVGAPEKPLAFSSFSLIFRRRSIMGSIIGGIRETQEMLDYCGKNGIVSDVELIQIQKVNEAYERVIKGDVRYRFVIDMKSLSQ